MDPEIATDFPREIIVDFSMSRYGGGFALLPIDVDRMVSTLSEHLATLSFEMADELGALHYLDI